MSAHILIFLRGMKVSLNKEGTESKWFRPFIQVWDK